MPDGINEENEKQQIGVLETIASSVKSWEFMRNKTEYNVVKAE